ncbi:MAG: glycosyltransferase family 2 protein, partial [Candidatus Eisenbacteria bacterium]
MRPSPRTSRGRAAAPGARARSGSPSDGSWRRAPDRRPPGTARGAGAARPGVALGPRILRSKNARRAGEGRDGVAGGQGRSRPHAAARQPHPEAPLSVTPWWPLWLGTPPEGPFSLGSWTHNLVFVVLFCVLVDFVKLVIELLGRNEERLFTSEPSQVTAVIPSRNGAGVLPGTVGELAKQVDPSRILVVDDASKDRTSEVAKALGCDVLRFEKRKGKAAAVNYAVHRVKTPYTLLLDDDTRLGGARIPTSLLSDDGYDAVAFHVLPDRRNRDGSAGNNLWGHIQRYEYGKSMEIGKRFHDVTQSVSCVSGAIG